MRNGDVKEADSGNNSNTIGSNIGAPVQNDKKSASDHNNLEVTLEIRDDSVAVHSVQPATEGGGGGGGEEEEGHEDPEPESKLSWVRSSLLQSASLHIKCMVSFSRRSSDKSMTSSKRYDQMKSAADALKGLKFITTPKTGEEGNDWNAVEKRFDKLTASTNGLLHSSMFGECIEFSQFSFLPQLNSALNLRSAPAPTICSGACCSTSDFSQFRVFTFSNLKALSSFVQSIFFNLASACSIFSSSTHPICFNKSRRQSFKEYESGVTNEG